MTRFFEHSWLLLGLLAIPALAIVGLITRQKQQHSALLFGGPVLGTRIIHLRSGWARGLLLSTGLALLVVGMAGPRWGRDWGQSAAPGRDLVVVFDLSRSMFAEAPSRIERGKEVLIGLAEGLRRQGGHRVGLVLFAGSAQLACPLTHDLDHFRDAVEGIDEKSPPPGLAPGTRIGAAIAAGLEAFEGRGSEARDILIVSDGDDPARDGEFRAGSERARSEGVPVHCLAIGDAENLHRIPIPGGWLSHDGKPALTRLEEAPLSEIARRTGGQLIRIGGAPIDLAAYYLQWSRDNSPADSPDTLPAYQQRQGWFLIPAFLVLALAVWLPTTWSRP